MGLSRVNDLRVGKLAFYKHFQVELFSKAKKKLTVKDFLLGNLKDHV